jgi:hypothetical protein
MKKLSGKHIASLDSLILTIRDDKVLLDLDLAKIYGVSTKRLNEQVKRNASRFPKDFIFQLSTEEKAEVVANCDHLARLKFSPNLPYAFTEHGAIMAAMVLNSPQAVVMSVYVVRAFLQTREQIIANVVFLKRLAEIDKTLLEHDHALRGIWTKLQPLLAPLPKVPKRKIGFNRDNE